MSEEGELGGDNRPIRYVEQVDGGEKVVYRASSLGACERALVAAANGYAPSPKPDWFQEVLDEGSAAESLINAMWEDKSGYPTVADQHEVELEIGEIDGRLIVVRGHIDGMAPGTSPKLREYKKFRDSTWQKFLQRGVECNVNYPWQVSIYMHALGAEECEFVGGHAAFDEWSNNLSISEVYCHRLAQPPFSLKAIRQRVIRIERLINTGFDAKEVDCQMSMYPCPYFKLHDVPDDDFELPCEGDLGIATAALVSRFAIASADVKRVQEELKRYETSKQEAATGLRAVIEELGPAAEAAKKLLHGEYVVTRVRKHTAAHMRKASDSDYFTIKPISKKEGK